jgi:hypothetical protein
VAAYSGDIKDARYHNLQKILFSYKIVALDNNKRSKNSTLDVNGQH